MKRQPKLFEDEVLSKLEVMWFGEYRHISSEEEFPMQAVAAVGLEALMKKGFKYYPKCSDHDYLLGHCVYGAIEGKDFYDCIFNAIEIRYTQVHI